MRPKLKIAIGSIAGVLLCAAVAATWMAIDLYRFAQTPAGGGQPAVMLTVMSGESLIQLSARLQAEGLITDGRRFRWLARLRGDDKRLKAGEYRLTAAMTPIRLLDVFVSGDVFLHVLTVPEGFTMAQIAAELDRQGLTDGSRFLSLASTPEVVASFGLEGKTLEGFLFPDTYHFPKGVSPQTIITRMVERFREQFHESWYQRARQMGLSLLEVVTLASIIEKETGDPAERPLISSVFHNRLKKGMRLESDPTVIYGIKGFDGNLTKKHLSTPTPYNTYRIRGLPPGPIANPGRPAIEAALYPAQSNYLYFVAKKDGTHYFSTTIAEHNAAVRKYQLRRRGKRK
jgi:peptidoglycan lytic transglycosylase G